MRDKPAEERKLFKDYFDVDAAKRLSAQVARVYPSLDRRKFHRVAGKELSSLEFAGRVQNFADALRTTLPDDLPQALAILTESLPAEMPGTEAVTDGFLQWPVGQFIADHGLPHFDESMTAMIALTKRFSSEFAVRPFVEQRPEETFERLLALTTDPNPHVRRWCSEGTRPRLPWGRKLHDLVADPSPIWPILDALKDDDELYVRRSVANNINDIAKDHAATVVKRCRSWSKKSNADRDWLIAHALRTLVKDGNPGALAVVGYGPPKALTATLKLKPKRIEIGDSVELVAELSTTHARAQGLLIDYVVHYVRKGNKTSAKVFKWTKTRLSARGTLRLDKRHAMKITTIRALYPGRHRVELQVNGVRVAESVFHLA